MNRQGHTEGAGLGAPPVARDYMGADTMARTPGARLNLDYYHQRLPDAVVMPIADFRKLIRRIGKFSAVTSKTDVAAIECGLFSMGGLVYKEWNHYGAVSVIKNNPPDQKTRMGDRRKSYEAAQDVQGNFVMVERSKVEAFRRQVALQQLALAERAAERETERIRRLKASIT